MLQMIYHCGIRNGQPQLDLYHIYYHSSDVDFFNDSFFNNGMVMIILYMTSPSLGFMWTLNGLYNIYIYIIILKPEDVCCLRLTPFVSPLVSDRSIPQKKCNREIREIFTNLAFADTTAVGTEQEIDMFFLGGGIYY
jgi:hypothetical protein